MASERMFEVFYSQYPTGSSFITIHRDMICKRGPSNSSMAVFQSRSSFFHQSYHIRPQKAATNLDSRLDTHQRRPTEFEPPEIESSQKNSGYVEDICIEQHGVRHIAEYHLISEESFPWDYEIVEEQRRKKYHQRSRNLSVRKRDHLSSFDVDPLDCWITSTTDADEDNVWCLRPSVTNSLSIVPPEIWWCRDPMAIRHRLALDTVAFTKPLSTIRTATSFFAW